MGNDRKQSRFVNDWILYSIVFCLIAGVLCLLFAAGGKVLIWNNDGFSLALPDLIFTQDHLPQLLGQGTSELYSFTSGMGSSVSISSDPFVLLGSLIRAGSPMILYSVLVLLRLYAAGIGVLCLFRYHGRTGISVVSAVLVYLCGSYFLYLGMQQPGFLTVMVCFPLLILGLDLILDGRNGLMFAGMVGVTMYCNYYHLYMATIVGGIYYLIRISAEKKGMRLLFFRRSFLKMILYYLLGFGIGAVSFLPQIISYFSSQRSVSSASGTAVFLFFDREWLRTLFVDLIGVSDWSGAQVIDGYLPLLGLAPIALFSVFYVISLTCRKEKNTSERVLCRIVWVTGILMLIPAFSFLMSGFSVVTNRWYYIAVLVFASAAAFLGPAAFFAPSVRQTIFMAICTGVFGFLLFLWRREGNVTTAVGFMVLAAYILMGVIIRKKGIRSAFRIHAIVLALTIGTILLNMYYVFSPDKGDYLKEYSDRNQLTELKTKSVASLSAEIEDDSFYRIDRSDITQPTISSAPILGYNGIASFNVTQPTWVKQYQDELENAGMTHLNIILSMDRRAALNALAGVKYYLAAPGAEGTVPYGYQLIAEDQRGGIYRNDYALPLGYTYDTVLPAEEYEKLSALEKQEAMLQAAVVERTEIMQNAAASQLEPSSAENAAAAGTELQNNSTENESPMVKQLSAEALSLTSQKCDVEIIDTDHLTVKDNKIVVKKKHASLTLGFDGMKHAETYLCFRGLNVNRLGRVNVKITVETDLAEKSFRAQSDSYIYSQHRNNYMVNLGYSEQAQNRVTITFPKKGTYTFDEIAVICQPMDAIAAQTAHLTEDVMEDVQITEHDIFGNITLDREKLLCLSIPYDDGWTAVVDGEKADLLKVNTMYMGLMLTPGAHAIQLTYQKPGLQTGLAVTGGAIALFVVLCILHAVRKRKRLISEGKPTHFKRAER